MAAVTFARELQYLNRSGSMLNITSQWQDPQILIFFFFAIKSILQEIGRTLKPIVPKFCPHLSVRLKDIAEKQVPTKLKPIEESRRSAVPPLSQLPSVATRRARAPPLPALPISCCVAAKGMAGPGLGGAVRGGAGLFGFRCLKREKGVTQPV